MTDSGFLRAQSDNLPKIDAIMMASFIAGNSNFLSAEFRGFKATRSARENYGDSAVGYVQVKRIDDVCTVKARVTPEHKIRTKAYAVTLICNEALEVIDSCKCDDCPASQGGCKHALAFLSWLHRRSEEPPKTSTQCYWKRSKMAGIGTSLKFIKAKDMGTLGNVDLPEDNGSFLRKLVDAASTSVNAQLTKYYGPPTPLENLSIHNMECDFFKNNMGSTPSEFIEFCKKSMTIEACQKAAYETISQSDSPLWHNLRYGRVTASKFHEAAHCCTLDGSLVETILGAKVFETKAIQRGRILEERVLKVVEATNKIKLKKCGLILSNEYPIFGASPDAMGEDFIVEVKCPAKESTMKNYLTESKEPTPKAMAQMQLQMHFAQKPTALYCVANHDFETSNKVIQLHVKYDEELCKELIIKCTEFWSNAIFKKLKYKWVDV